MEQNVEEGIIQRHGQEQNPGRVPPAAQESQQQESDGHEDRIGKSQPHIVVPPFRQHLHRRQAVQSGEGPGIRFRRAGRRAVVPSVFQPVPNGLEPLSGFAFLLIGKEQLVEGNAVQAGQRDQVVGIRRSLRPLPFRYRLTADPDLFRQLLL